MSDFKLSEAKLYKPFSNDFDKIEVIVLLKKILAKEKDLVIVAAIYGIFIALLSLAVPVSVQLLINSVAFTALLQPVIVLGLILLILLSFWGVLNALQFYVTEIFQRKFFARMSAELGSNLLEAQYSLLEQANQSEFVNRFFDVVTVQKIIPRFLTQTFSLILQIFFGLLLVSFYHPILLVFSLSIIASLYFIWSLYGKKAISTSFYESRRKYDLVAWLEELAHNNKIFKSDFGQEYGKFKIDFLTKQYIKERKDHFKNLFSQTILLFALYAITSSILLIIGGWLVLKSQLTLGQLVAAEIVLSGVLYGISQFSKDFDSFYDLAAACEKLSQFYNIPLEKKSGIILNDEALNVKFREADKESFSRKYFFDFSFVAGKNYLVSTEGSGVQKLLIDFLDGFKFPEIGGVEFNGYDVSSLDLYSLRSKIVTIDNNLFLEGTIEEYLTFNNRLILKNQVNEVLKITGFDKVMARIGLNSQSRMIPSGFPFSESEKILLKVARAILLQPKIIIITEVLDMIALPLRQKILQYLTKSNATIIYFSSRRDQAMDFDEYLFIDHEKSSSFSSIEELEKFEEQFFATKNH